MPFRTDTTGRSFTNAVYSSSRVGVLQNGESSAGFSDEVQWNYVRRGSFITTLEPVRMMYPATGFVSDLLEL